MSASDASPIGLAGRIVTATGGPHHAGEVELRIRGGTELFIARSADPLAVGTAVLVLSTLGPRTVIVAPWIDPVDSLLNLDADVGLGAADPGSAREEQTPPDRESTAGGAHADKLADDAASAEHQTGQEGQMGQQDQIGQQHQTGN